MQPRSSDWQRWDGGSARGRKHERERRRTRRYPREVQRRRECCAATTQRQVGVSFYEFLAMLAAAEAYNTTLFCSGQCRRGLSCPYVHSSTQLAICPGALRPSGCNQPPGLCPLSHTLDPRRVPHCVHFLSTRGQCRGTHPDDAGGTDPTDPTMVGRD